MKLLNFRVRLSSYGSYLHCWRLEIKLAAELRASLGNVENRNFYDHFICAEKLLSVFTKK